MTRPRHPGIALLWHVRIGPEDDWVDAPWDNDGTDCLVGLYSSAASAQDAVARLRGKPGFSDWPEGFAISVWRLDEDMCPEGFGAGQDAGPRQS